MTQPLAPGHSFRLVLHSALLTLHSPVTLHPSAPSTPFTRSRLLPFTPSSLHTFAPSPLHPFPPSPSAPSLPSHVPAFPPFAPSLPSHVHAFSPSPLHSLHTFPRSPLRPFTPFTRSRLLSFTSIPSRLPPRPPNPCPCPVDSPPKAGRLVADEGASLRGPAPRPRALLSRRFPRSRAPLGAGLLAKRPSRAHYIRTAGHAAKEETESRGRPLRRCGSARRKPKTRTYRAFRVSRMVTRGKRVYPLVRNVFAGNEIDPAKQELPNTYLDRQRTSPMPEEVASPPDDTDDPSPPHSIACRYRLSRTPARQ